LCLDSRWSLLFSLCEQPYGEGYDSRIPLLDAAAQGREWQAPELPVVAVQTGAGKPAAITAQVKSLPG